MHRPLLRAAMTALLLDQTLCSMLTGAARGQAGADDAKTPAPPVNAACGQELQRFGSGVEPGRVGRCSASPPTRPTFPRLARRSSRERSA